MVADVRKSLGLKGGTMTRREREKERDDMDGRRKGP